MRPTKTPKPTKLPTHSPTKKPTKSPTLKPTKQPTIPKPTHSPTNHPTMNPTDAWDNPQPVASKSGKNGRKKAQHDSKEQGFDELIQSANTNRGLEQNCITFYDCADLQMMHQLERDLMTKEDGNALIIVHDLEYHKLSKDKSKDKSTKYVKEYYTGAHSLAAQLTTVEECFVPCVTASNGTILSYTYDVKQVKKWIKTVIYSIGISGNSTRTLFNEIYDSVSERHSNSNVSSVHDLLAFMKDVFQTAPDMWKQMQLLSKPKIKRMNTPYNIPLMVDIDPVIFHSASVMRVVLDFLRLSWLGVINLICDMVTDSFNSWATHSHVINATKWNQERMAYRLELKTSMM
eukprot:869941_1